jgi:hypothetical protein
MEEYDFPIRRGGVWELRGMTVLIIIAILPQTKNGIINSFLYFANILNHITFSKS